MTVILDTERPVSETHAKVVAIANVKGGVGKSTVILMLAEALAYFEGLRVLVIDSDPQTSASIMLMPKSHLDYLSHEQRTLPDFLTKAESGVSESDYENIIRNSVSDIHDVRTISLIPSDIKLALLEKEISRYAEPGEAYATNTINGLLNYAKRHFDIILIDCAAGLTLLNDIWLQLVDYHIVPVKPDYLSVLALNILDQSIQIMESRGQVISERLGTIVNMKPPIMTEHDRKWVRTLMSEPIYKAFPIQIPLSPAIREATELSSNSRAFQEKYPGDLGFLVELFMSSIVERLYAPAMAEQVNTGGF